MRNRARLAANVRVNSLVLGVACVLALALPVGKAQGPVPVSGAAGAINLSQAVITYGFLRWDYLEFDQLVTASSNLALVQNLKALDAALDSLHCDVPTRIAGPHRALILPSSLIDQWVGFDRPNGRKSPERGWLFVTQPRDTAPQRVLVVFSSAAPEHTTILWLEGSGNRYAARLLYDSSRKGKVSNETTILGAVTEVRFEKDNEVLLKDWGEPGIGPPEVTEVRRVFRLDQSKGTVTLADPGRLQCH